MGEEMSRLRPELGWDIDGMSINVYEAGEVVLSISLCEAMESTSRFLVESHIAEIERSPWISRWHDTDQDLFPEA
jgi:hypothetical protein